MPFLRTKSRTIKTADSISAMSRIVERYIDFNSLRVADGVETRPVKSIIGIDFSGSRFGPHIVNVLPNHVRHFFHHRRK